MSDDVKLDIGRDLTKGLGAGSDPDIGLCRTKGISTKSKRALKGADTCSLPLVRVAVPALRAFCYCTGCQEPWRTDHWCGHCPFGFEGKRRSTLRRYGYQDLEGKGRHPHCHPERPIAYGLE